MKLREIILCIVVGTFGLSWFVSPTYTLETALPLQASLTSATADETLGTAVGVARCRETAAYVDWSAGVISGVVTIETAKTPGYAGTWAPLAVLTFEDTAPKQNIAQITGVQQWVRGRVSTIISGGGDVDVDILCN